MRAKITIYRGSEPTPVVTAECDGDPMEILDMFNELNMRWPGRRAELETIRTTVTD